MTTVTQTCGFTLIVTDEIPGMLLFYSDGRLAGKIVNLDERSRCGPTTELLNLAARAIRVQPCEK